MASLEDLPADQRAVLQLVLQRGRTYDEIAGMLSIDRSSVRQRALDACDALTPDGIEPGPEQTLVTDYLLTQLPQQVADQVYIYLEAAAEDRGWAQAIASQLAQLAATALPPIPVAAPLRSDTLVVADESSPLPFEQHAPPPVSATVAEIDSTSSERGAVPRTNRPRSDLAPAVQQRRTMLVGALSLLTAIVAVAVVVLLNDGGSPKPRPRRTHTYTQAPGTTSTQATTTTATQILAALNLTSPVGATQTLGVAQIVRVNGVIGIVIDAQGVPANSAHNAYGLWLYNSAKSHKFVGFDPNLVGKNEKLSLEGPLPAGAAHYKRLLITLETQQHPKYPGEVVLSGPFREK